MFLEQDWDQFDPNHRDDNGDTCFTFMMKSKTLLSNHIVNLVFRLKELGVDIDEKYEFAYDTFGGKEWKSIGSLFLHFIFTCKSLDKQLKMDILDKLFTENTNIGESDQN